MTKDFKKWHEKKTNIHNIPQRPFFNVGEIWFCHLGVNVGSEQDGAGNDFLRPIVIVRKFNNEIFWAVPLTRIKKSSQYYFPFKFRNETSVAILSQMRLIDARRLGYRLGKVAAKTVAEIRKRLRLLLR